ncbi:MAG: DUF1624 domain-containing protein [Bacteroidales bacterium]|nr:DUF1624 domain-containing protein [Bacteroidales bacterium]
MKPQRYIALDVLRGFTVALMILVNNPGSDKAFAPLHHAPWNGCTPTDLVYPFFLFCVGAAITFAFARHDFKPGARLSWKILKRGLLIFAVGLFLNLLPHAFSGEGLSHLRIFGVLQRIAICYVCASFLILWLRSPRKILAAAGVLLVAHHLILLTAGEGWSTLEGNVERSFNLLLLGPDHLYKGYGIPFDPEGLVGTLSSCATVLLGFLAGSIAYENDNKARASTKLLIGAAACLALGRIWSLWLPINKALWTGSYALYTAGWAALILAGATWLIDVKGYVKPFAPLRAFGMNPLLLYVLAEGTAIVCGYTGASWWYYSHVCTAVCGGDNGIASLFFSFTLIFLLWIVAWILYKKKIVIKL